MFPSVVFDISLSVHLIHLAAGACILFGCHNILQFRFGDNVCNIMYYMYGAFGIMYIWEDEFGIYMYFNSRITKSDV